MATLELGYGTLERFAIGMIRPRIVVPFVLAELFVDVGGGLIDRRNNGAGRRIRFLPDMNGVGGKTHLDLLAMPRVTLN